MSTGTHLRDDPLPPLPPSERESRSAARIAALMTVLLVTLVALVGGCGIGSPPPPPAAPPMPGPRMPAPTAPPMVPPSTVPQDPGQGAIAVWPHGQTGVRYSSPEAAARGFAVDMVGFRNPVVGPYRAADASSGDVEVRPEVPGPVTTVSVRRFRDGNWWVLGAATSDIHLTSPTAGEAVSSPMTLAGEALASEGRVPVRIMQDRSSEPLATSSVAGGDDMLRPFSAGVAFPQPSSDHGSVVVTTENARGGQVWSASVVRISFETGR